MSETKQSVRQNSHQQNIGSPLVPAITSNVNEHSVRSTTDTNSQEITSPSKSIKNFFKNRLSAYSIDSLSKQPELDGYQNKKNSISSLGSELSPTRSPKSITNGLNIFLKPRFMKSKSSFITISSNNSSLHHEQLDQMSFHAGSLRQGKPTTLEDFADTSSENDSTKGGDLKNYYDSESIISILEEYEEGESKFINKTQKDNFIFQEEFEESLPLIENESKKEVTIKIGRSSSSSTPNTSLIRKNESQPKSIIDQTLTNSTNSSSDSSTHGGYNDKADSPTSPKYNICSDKETIPYQKETDLRKLIDRRKVISTSSNIDVFNRSSLYNLTTVSDIDDSKVDESNNEEVKYPEPNISDTVSPSNTPQKNNNGDHDPIDRESISLQQDTSVNESSISERPITSRINTDTSSAKIIEKINDETAIRVHGVISNRDTTRISMSSGELLSKLQSFYEQDESRKTEKISSGDPLKDDIPDFKTKVEVKLESSDMAHKVYDKDIDKERQDNSAHKNNTEPHFKTKNQKSNNFERLIAQKVEKVSLPHKAYLSSSIPSSSSASQISSTPSKILKKSSSNKYYIEKNFNARIGDFRHDKPRSMKTKSSYVSLTKPTSNIILSDNLTKKTSHERMFNKESSSKNYMTFDSPSISIDDLEKNIYSSRSTSAAAKVYSWTYFSMMMLLGLVIPPLHFLITLGVFDITSGYNKYYTGIYYRSQQSQNLSVKSNRRFSKTQKIFSLLIGFIWFTIVLALIGVGLGIGINRES